MSSLNDEDNAKFSNEINSVLTQDLTSYYVWTQSLHFFFFFLIWTPTRRPLLDSAYYAGSDVGVAWCRQQLHVLFECERILTWPRERICEQHEQTGGRRVGSGVTTTGIALLSPSLDRESSCGCRGWRSPIPGELARQATEALPIETAGGQHKFLR